MNKKSFWLILPLALVLLSFVVVAFIVVGETERSVDLDSNDSFEVRYTDISQGVSVKGSVSVESIVNKYLNFYINDPVERQLLMLVKSTKQQHSVL